VNRGNKSNVNRSALTRHALQEHPKHLHLLELEERDRRGYEAQSLHGQKIESRRCAPLPIRGAFALYSLATDTEVIDQRAGADSQRG